MESFSLSLKFPCVRGNYSVFHANVNVLVYKISIQYCYFLSFLTDKIVLLLHHKKANEKYTKTSFVTHCTVLNAVFNINLYTTETSNNCWQSESTVLNWNTF